MEIPTGTITFKRSAGGLFYYTTAEPGALSFAHIFGADTNEADMPTNPAEYDMPHIQDPTGRMVPTTGHTSEGFSKYEVAQARQACRAHAMIVHPSDADYKSWCVSLIFSKIAHILYVISEIQLTSLVVPSDPPQARPYGSYPIRW